MKGVGMFRLRMRKQSWLVLFVFTSLFAEEAGRRCDPDRDQISHRPGFPSCPAMVVALLPQTRLSQCRLVHHDPGAFHRGGGGRLSAEDAPKSPQGQWPGAAVGRYGVGASQHVVFLLCRRRLCRTTKGRGEFWPFSDILCDGARFEPG